MYYDANLLLVVSGGLSGGDIAAMTTAVGGIVLGYITSRHQRKVQDGRNATNEHVAILEGYAAIVHDLQEEVARMRKQYSEDTETFEKEKQKLLQHIAALEEELAMWKDKVTKLKYDNTGDSKN